MALITIGVVSILASFIPTFVNSGLKQAKVTRLRSQMKVVETRLRSQLNQYTAFTGCLNSQIATTCKINKNLLMRFSQIKTPGTECSDMKTCGITLFTYVPDPLNALNVIKIPINFNQDLQLQPGIGANSGSTLLARLMLSYTGEDVSLKDTKLDIEVPYDVLQESVSQCGIGVNIRKPIFKGYAANGQAICDDALDNPCPGGQYVSAIDPRTLKITCQNIPAPNNCDINSMISNFKWNAGPSLSHVCSSRIDPYILFPFNNENPTTIDPTPTPTPSVTPTPPPRATGMHCDIGGPWGWRADQTSCPAGTNPVSPSKVGGCSAGWTQYGDLGCYVSNTSPLRPAGCSSANPADECCVMMCSATLNDETWSCNPIYDPDTGAHTGQCDCVSNFSGPRYARTKREACAP